MSDAPLTVLAAGSLRAAFGPLARLARVQAGLVLACRHGPAGTLRRQIEAGAAFDLFASADMGHPQAVVAQGLAAGLCPFAGNRLVAYARADLPIDTATVVDALLDPAIRLATSTPGADPGGDYALAVFDRVERMRPGAGAILRAKAMALVGGPGCLPVPTGRSAAAWVINGGRADLMLGYRSNAAAVRGEGGVQVVALPDGLMPAIVYGLCWSGARGAALARLLRHDEAGAILAAAGFDPLPQPEVAC